MKDKHQQIQGEYREQMNALAAALDDHINPDGEKKTGFCLMLFPFGEAYDGRANYISNAKRSEIIQMLKDLVHRFEEQSINEELGNAASHN